MRIMNMMMMMIMIRKMMTTSTLVWSVSPVTHTGEKLENLNFDEVNHSRCISLLVLYLSAILNWQRKVKDEIYICIKSQKKPVSHLLGILAYKADYFLKTARNASWVPDLKSGLYRGFVLAEPASASLFTRTPLKTETAGDMHMYESSFLYDPDFVFFSIDDKVGIDIPYHDMSPHVFFICHVW